MTAADNALLKSAIERLYAVFGRYRPPTVPTYCHHCVNGDEDRVLRLKRGKRLSTREVGYPIDVTFFAADHRRISGLRPGHE